MRVCAPYLEFDVFTAYHVGSMSCHCKCGATLILKAMALWCYTAKLVETGTFGGEEDDDVLFDDMVEEYDDEDDAIEAVS